LQPCFSFPLLGKSQQLQKNKQSLRRCGKSRPCFSYPKRTTLQNEESSILSLLFTASLASAAHHTQCFVDCSVQMEATQLLLRSESQSGSRVAVPHAAMEDAAFVQCSDPAKATSGILPLLALLPRCTRPRCPCGAPGVHQEQPSRTTGK